jgi:hypothetical protein
MISGGSSIGGGRFWATRAVDTSITWSLSAGFWCAM